MKYTGERIINAYKSMMEGLSTNSKKELIDVLSRLLKSDSGKTETAFYESFGAFPDDKTMEEIIADIRSGRTFKTKDLGL